MRTLLRSFLKINLVLAITVALASKKDNLD
jgi:hypothetical protein